MALLRERLWVAWVDWPSVEFLEMQSMRIGRTKACLRDRGPKSSWMW